MLKALKSFKYIEKSTIIHKLDPRSKILSTILLSLGVLVSQKITPLIIVTIFCIILAITAKSLRQLLRVIRGIAPWAAFIFLLNCLTGSDKLMLSIAMSIKFVSLAAVFSLFFITTSPEDFMLALNNLGMPYEYTLAFTMAMRFVPSLARDLQTIIDAQRSRGLELDKGNFIERVRKYIPILVPLIVYEIRRSFMIAEALESRAFGSGKRSSFYKLKITYRDFVFAILSSILLAVILFIDIALPW
ncbi:MAG: hypothetical protein DRJ52_01070 [Thermoprotei archaeon]|nr:MAG: hypothetical protein DRJ52_01070 [Thermoprotei archaeon]RLF01068.1 MAG: hypothetical protein DRJ63_00625 [Thermoprotei archaeon]